MDLPFLPGDSSVRKGASTWQHTVPLQRTRGPGFLLWSCSSNGVLSTWIPESSLLKGCGSSSPSLSSDQFWLKKEAHRAYNSWSYLYEKTRTISEERQKLYQTKLFLTVLRVATEWNYFGWQKSQDSQFLNGYIKGTHSVQLPSTNDLLQNLNKSFMTKYSNLLKSFITLLFKMLQGRRTQKSHLYNLAHAYIFSSKTTATYWPVCLHSD